VIFSLEYTGYDELGQKFREGKFSDDGLLFSLSDDSGKLTIYGMSEPYTDYLPFQFFITDYREFLRGNDDRLVDKETNGPADEVGRTDIYDMDGIHYSQDLQPPRNYGTNFPAALSPDVLDLSLARREANYENEKKLMFSSVMKGEEEETDAPVKKPRSTKSKPARVVESDSEEVDDYVPDQPPSSGDEFFGTESEASESSGSEGDRSSDSGDDCKCPLPPFLRFSLTHTPHFFSLHFQMWLSMMNVPKNEGGRLQPGSRLGERNQRPPRPPAPLMTTMMATSTNSQATGVRSPMTLMEAQMMTIRMS